MRRQLITVLCLFLVQINNGQQNTPDNKEFYFSASTGLSAFGPDMNEYMRVNGFDEPSLDFFGGGQIQHPFSNKHIIYTFTLTYFPNDRLGFALDYCLLNNQNVNGYKGDPISVLGKYSFLKTKLHLASVTFCYRITDKTELLTGPAVLLHRVSEEHVPAGNATQSENVKPALQIGAIQELFSGNWWFTALSVRYCLAPKSQIGPFAKNGEDFMLAASKVNISTLYIGLSVGLKFYQQ